MSRRAAALAVLLVIAGCATPPRPPQGEALLLALQGAWCNSDDGGRTCWAWDQFFADGTLRACGRQPDERQPFDGEGRVTVEGDRMCYVVTRASPNFWVRPGSRYCTRIVAIGAREHTYEDLETGQRFTLTRVPATGARCPG